MLSAGRLRHRIDVERTSGNLDAYGGSDGSAVALVHEGVPAEVRPAKAGEDERGRRIEASHEYEVTLRYIDSIESSDVVLWEGKRLHVAAILHDLRRTTTTLRCGSDDV